MASPHFPPTQAVRWALQDSYVPATANLDIFWLKDEALKDSANLPAPDLLAAEIIEDLRAALEQFEAAYADLAGSGEADASDAAV